MSMHQGLDLSRFKKVSSDKKTTTLRHAKGHEIKIAHSALTPAMKEKIASLPDHDEKPVRMAKGGQVQKFADKGIVEKDDDTDEDDAEADPDAPAADSPADASSPAAATPAQPMDAQSPAQTTDQTTPAAQPSPSAANTITVTGQRTDDQLPMPTPPTPMTAQEMADEHASFNDDLAANRINPKTYQDILWNDKSTPGKIGSLFGLMLSGMGSGLAHQPNMLMGMMDKQIDNDLNAQKASKEGARNLYQLHMQHQLNRFQAQKDYYDAAMSRVTANMGPAQKKLIAAQTANADAGAKRALADTAEVMGKVQLRDHMLGMLGNTVGNMGDGPLKMAGTNLLQNTVAPGVNQSNAQDMQNAAGRGQLIQAMSPYPAIPGAGPLMNDQSSGQPDPSAPMFNTNALQAYSMVPETHEQATKATDEIKNAEDVKDTTGRYVNSFNNLNTSDAGQDKEVVAGAISLLGPAVGPLISALTAGKSPQAALVGAIGDKAITPAMEQAAETIRKFQQYRQSQIGAVLPEVSRMITGQYNPAEAKTLEDTIFPNIYDFADEKTRKAKFDTAIGLLKNKARTTTADMMPGVRVGKFPDYQYQPMKTENKAQREAPPEKQKGRPSQAPGGSLPSFPMVDINPSPFQP